MNSRSRLPRSGLALCAFVNGMALAIAAPAVMAQGTAQPSSGLMKFANVSHEAATPETIARAARMSSTARGVRAFRDPVTGQLRDQTPEEMAAEAFNQVPDGATSAPMGSRKGGVMVELDDAFMSNAVVSRGASGKLELQCVTGGGHAIEAALGKRGTVKGDRHDH